MAIFKGKIRHKKANGTYDYLLPETVTSLIKDETTEEVLTQTLSTLRSDLNTTTNKANNPYTIFQANGNKITPNDLSAETLALVSGTGTVNISQGYLENNRGAIFPLKYETISGISTTLISMVTRNAILDAKIFGAVPGMVYRLTYLANGFESMGGPRYGVTLEEHTYSNLATGNSRTRYVFVYNNNSNAENFNLQPGNSNIQTIILQEGSLTLSLTVDRSVITASTIPLALVLGTNAAQSYIIDPANYYY